MMVVGISTFVAVSIVTRWSASRSVRQPSGRVAGRERRAANTASR